MPRLHVILTESTSTALADLMRLLDVNKSSAVRRAITEARDRYELAATARDMISASAGEYLPRSVESDLVEDR